VDATRDLCHDALPAAPGDRADRKDGHNQPGWKTHKPTHCGFLSEACQSNSANLLRGSTHAAGIALLLLDGTHSVTRHAPRAGAKPETKLVRLVAHDLGRSWRLAPVRGTWRRCSVSWHAASSWMMGWWNDQKLGGRGTKRTVFSRVGRRKRILLANAPRLRLLARRAANDSCRTARFLFLNASDVFYFMR
jgi:hypothetical protein